MNNPASDSLPGESTTLFYHWLTKPFELLVINPQKNLIEIRSV